MPARLVYSPKVYAYTRNQAGATLNLSSYVTKGSVRRLVDQVSTAEITLRNPYKRFTTPSVGVAFHPMDPITIYLERVAGHPVRVFTGYLDETPYYQMYPGEITLKASCTLKRLLYQYFDPSLPYVIAFFEKYGWINTGQGSIISAQNFDGTGGASIADVNAGKLPFDQLKDGSLSKLLWAVLTDIGEWDDTNIYIEDIPSGIAARMAALMKSIQSGEQLASDELSTFLGNVIGGSQGGANGTSGGGTPSGNVSGAKQIVQVVQPIASQYNVPLEMVLAVMYIETGFTNHDSAGNPHYGWFQVQTANPPYAYGTWSSHIPTQQEAHDLGLSATAFCSAAAGWASHDPGLRSNIQQWAMATQGVTGSNNPYYVTGWPTALATAQSYISQFGGVAAGIGTGLNNITNQPGALGPPSQTTTPDVPFFPMPKGSGYVGQSSWTQDQGVDIAAPGDTPLLAVGGGTVVLHGISGFGPWAPVLRLDTPIQGQQYIYYGHAGPNGLAKVGTHLTAGQQIASVGPGIVGLSSGPHLEIGFCDANGSPVSGTSSLMFQTLTSAQAGQPVPGGGGGSTGGGATGGVSSDTTAQAFVAELNFPSIEDQVTAIALGAEHKGLMHDQQLLPFVQQLAQASMRSFQSLPNGDFFAFYPDYFGEMGHHKPYWLIDDIEVLSGGINLSDDSLVTHMFAVGDNTWPVNNELLNMLFSAGAINIFNAFVGAGLVDTSNIGTKKGDVPQDASKGLAPGILDAAEAVKFIKRYGARPLVQNYPMVRSPIYEMLLGYQQFMLAWSNQFKTPFTFTFMPELYPGGKVGFPNHGIQMYISSVTHSWDLSEGGFTTTAELTAPSLLDGASAADFPDIPPLMVRALVEPVATGNPDANIGTPAQIQAERQQVQQTVDAVDQGVQQVAGDVGSIFGFYDISQGGQNSPH